MTEWILVMVIVGTPVIEERVTVFRYPAAYANEQKCMEKAADVLQGSDSNLNIGWLCVEQEFQDATD